ncbi:MAG TPA: OB-fold nucleic acid binding domain-containing protein, partial [Candidatus Saccharimonadia bacterium]|nr:OB-fold nucleic acid binding domain-containing protein [Candidatus Saccharimonadia bacterium]
MNEHEAAAPGAEPQDENRLIAERRSKLDAIRARGIAYPNDFRPDAFSGDLQRDFEGIEADAVEAAQRRVRIAGRLVLKRVQGKVSFAQLQDMTGRIQLFVHQGTLGDPAYDAFRECDVGDILGCEGTLMRTRTGELSLKCESLRLLSKSLRPLPDKWHGLADIETRYRQRYADL